MPKTTVSFSLDTEADRDIIQWLDRQPNRSAAFRSVVREHLIGGVTLTTVYQAVRDLERRLVSATITTVPDNGSGKPQEPADAAAALDALAALG